MNLTQIVLIVLVYLSFSYLQLDWKLIPVVILGLAIMIVYGQINSQEKMQYPTSVNGVPGNQPLDQYPQGYRSPSDFNLLYDTVHITTVDKETLHGWFIPAQVMQESHFQRLHCPIVFKKKEEDSEVFEVITEGARRSSSRLVEEEVELVTTGVIHDKSIPTIVFFHANAGSINFRIPNLLLNAIGLQVNTLIVDYRGYGLSSGTPGEEGMLLDAQAIMKYVSTRTDVDQNNIVIFGRSLGGAVGIATCTEVPLPSDMKIRGLILENTFTSVGNIVDVLFPFLKPLKPFVLRLKWESLQRIAKLDTPVLFISGKTDEIIPPTHMEDLYNAVPATVYKTKLSVNNGMHNTTWVSGDADYATTIIQFLNVINNRQINTDTEYKLEKSSLKTTDKAMESIYAASKEQSEVFNYVFTLLRQIVPV